MNSEMIKRIMAMAGWSHDDYEAEAWNEMARVAITAMREPTTAMINTTPVSNLKAAWAIGNLEMAWQAMIDEPLR